MCAVLYGVVQLQNRIFGVEMLIFCQQKQDFQLNCHKGKQIEQFW